MRARLLLAAAGLVVLTLGLWLVLRHTGVLPGEAELTRRLRVTPSVSASSQLLAFFGEAGTPYVALMTVGLTTLVVGRTFGLWSGVLVLASSTAVFANDVIRAVLGPTPATGGAYVGSNVESFPSGHAAYVASFCGALAWAAARRGRSDVVVVLLVLILGMGVARVATGTHLPSDVLGGYAVGGAWLLLVLAALLPRLPVRAARTAPLEPKH